MNTTRCRPARNIQPDPAAPVSVGAGLFALDQLLIGRKRVRANQEYAGGSCGNVTAILAFFDWKSYAVARLGTDRTAQRLLDDLEFCRVNTDFVARETTGVTPVIILRLAEDGNGLYRSRFEWKDPVSGDRLPRYRPLPKSYAERITPDLPAAKVFYFDRAERSSLVLATAMRRSGAVAFFEPSSCKDDSMFTECLAVSDIVKYSADRIPKPPRNPASRSPRLEIQTLGGDGLRYRLKLATDIPGPWRKLGAFPVRQFRDATGCGDWCSAGIIARLCARGRRNFMSLPEAKITRGIRFGQALAAINCEYEGARGPMYQVAKRDLLARAEDLLARDHPAPR
ncbi:MAG: carbohydrate kinase family protein [Verrucomicrobiota bacterium]